MTHETQSRQYSLPFSSSPLGLAIFCEWFDVFTPDLQGKSTPEGLNPLSVAYNALDLN
jgi:hypothetical protein